MNIVLFAMDDEVARDDCWLKVIDEKINAIEKTWELTNVLNSKKIVGVKWVYKTKYKINGEFDCFKAILVAKSYKKKLNIDYFEVFELNYC